MSDKLIARFFILLYFLVGIWIFRDYGISWDENAQRVNNGLVNYNFVFEGKKKELVESPEKYHGPAFELLLFSVERACKLTDLRTIYLVRHLLTFLTFFISSCCIYFLSLQLFKKEKWALVAFLFYILSPRIFAEAFYNCKDVAFLSLFTISLLTFYQFTRKRNYGYLLLHAAVTGFMIDIRVTGILIPVLTAAVLISDLFFFSGTEPNRKKLLLLISVYAIVQFVFIVIFWPVLWENPVFHLTEAIKEMSRFPWKSEIRYLGKMINSVELPWHYAPLWIIISTPVWFIIFFFSGIIFVTKNIFSFRKKSVAGYKYDFVFLCCFFIPIILVVFFHSIIYDGWRHLYFLHAPFVFIATRGIMEITQWAEKKKFFSAGKFSGAYILVFVVVFIGPLQTLIKDHPHQNVYFNSIACKIFNPTEKYFEMDYWGLSYRQGLEYVLSVDPSASVKVHAESKPGKFNKQILTQADNARLEFIDNFYEPGIYYLAEFRGTIIPIDTNYFPLIHTIKNSSGTLMRIYRRTPGLYKPDTLFHQNPGFENEDVLPSGKFSDRTDSANHYSKSIQFTVDSSMEKSRISIRIKAWLNSAIVNPDVLFVLAADRGSQNILWKGLPLQGQINEKNKWLPFYANPSLPDTLLIGDVISAYFWNRENESVFFSTPEISLVKYRVHQTVK